MMEVLFENFLKETMPGIDNSGFHVQFYTDAFVGSFVRWLKSKEYVPPEEFQKLLETSVNITQDVIGQYGKVPPVSGGRI